MRLALLAYAFLMFCPMVISVIWLEDSIVMLAALTASILALATGVVAGIASRKRTLAFLVVCVGLVVCLGVTISVAVWDWPLRLAFAASRPALERAAADVRSGKQVVNERVGVFFIRSGNMTGANIPCLWTDTNPAGRTGFVQTRPDVLPFNLWSAIHLDDRWYLISED
jgi:hypothetical protein